MKTVIVDKTLQSITKIIEVLKNDGLVIVPSENVYGFAGNALSEKVIDRIYELKGRDRSKPLVYFTSKKKAKKYGVLNENAKKIIELWPEGVGIIVPKKDNVSEYVTAGGDTVMLVCVDEFLENLAEHADFPIVGTSANKSGQKSIVDFDEAYNTFNNEVDMIVKGDKSKRGLSGSIINLAVEPPTVLRVGPFSLEQMKELIPEIEG